MWEAPHGHILHEVCVLTHAHTAPGRVLSRKPVRCPLTLHLQPGRKFVVLARRVELQEVSPVSERKHRRSVAAAAQLVTGTWSPAVWCVLLLHWSHSRVTLLSHTLCTFPRGLFGFVLVLLHTSDCCYANCPLFFS